MRGCRILSEPQASTVGRSALAGLGAPLLLLGCTHELTIDLARRGDAVTITVSRSGRSEPPCVESLAVTRAGADIANTAPLWEVSAAEPGRCHASFVYGQAPAGYAQSGTAGRLLVGGRYLVEVTAPGMQAGREFTLGPASVTP